MQRLDEVRAPVSTDLGHPSLVQNAILWARANLFNGVFNTLLTIAILALLVWALPPFVRWAFVDSVWSSESPEVCRAAHGACWAFVENKFRLIIFGRYPFEQHWRPLIAMMVLIATALVSCDRRFWRASLAGIWVVAVLVFLWLMGGGPPLPPPIPALLEAIQPAVFRPLLAAISLDPVPTALWGGLPLTLMLAFVGMALAFPLAILLALGRRSDLPLIRALSVGYIELIRGVPLISLLFMASFMLPLFMPTGVNIDAVLRAQVAIILFAAAYLAEVIRGGLQALPKGQYEAADALALGFWRTQQLIVLPQALKIAIPPIVNTFIGLFKDTSLVAIVSLTDLLLATRQALTDPEWRQFFVEGYLFIALIYWAFCYFMSKYSQHLERALATGHRR